QLLEASGYNKPTFPSHYCRMITMLAASTRSSICLILVLAVMGTSAFAAPRRRFHAPAAASPVPSRPMQLTYPKTKTIEHVDDYHGTKVADPYRWLEDLDGEETRAWVEAQNKLTFDWLAHVPARETLRRRLTTLWNYERYGLPHKKNGRYF